jgi:hypothetical protein
MSRRRTGAIAQLPRAIRDHVNRMLDDGYRFNAIIDWLAANGHPGINIKQLSRWRKGGFQDWLELNRDVARQQKLRELAYDIATADEGIKPERASIQMAAHFLFRVLLKFDSDRLAKELDMDPTQITTVLNTFTRLSRRSTELNRIKENMGDHK